MACNPSREAVAIIFIKRAHFDEVQKKRSKNKAKKEARETAKLAKKSAQPSLTPTSANMRLANE